MWAAGGAGVGLGVEAAVRGVFVFAAAGGAHGKASHSGEGAIVGNVVNDAVARAAVGAVGEGVVVAAAVGVASFGEAVVAGGDVGGDEGKGGAGRVAFADGEGCVAGGRDIGAEDFGDADERRGFGAQGGEEGIDRGRRAFNLDEDAARGVEDEAGERVAAGEVVDPGTEADALDDAADMELAADCDGGGNGGRPPRIIMEREGTPLR